MTDGLSLGFGVVEVVGPMVVAATVHAGWPGPWLAVRTLALGGDERDLRTASGAWLVAGWTAAAVAGMFLVAGGWFMGSATSAMVIEGLARAWFALTAALFALAASAITARRLPGAAEDLASGVGLATSALVSATVPGTGILALSVVLPWLVLVR